MKILLCRIDDFTSFKMIINNIVILKAAQRIKVRLSDGQESFLKLAIENSTPAFQAPPPAGDKIKRGQTFHLASLITRLRVFRN